MVETLDDSGELQLPGNTYRAEVQMIASDRRVEVTCASVGDSLVFEGDIVLVLNANLEFYGMTVTGTRFRWNDRTVVYEMSSDLPHPQRVTDAISHWQERTVMRFRKRTHERDYVVFRPGPGCSSAVGRQGGVQFITLGPSYSVGNAVHEIGHTVGLWHEQSRNDRDAHLLIHWDNILPSAKHNFDQQVSDGDDQGPYDFESIMHYPRHAFAIDPTKPTLTPRSNVQIGQRRGLSDGDVAAVAEMYAR